MNWQPINLQLSPSKAGAALLGQPRHVPVRLGIFLGLSLLLGAPRDALGANPAYEQWARTYFGTDVEDPEKKATVWGESADPDHDGRVNLLEYALGTDPSSGADASVAITVTLFQADETTAQLEATYMRRTSDALLRYLPMVSADAVTWESGNAVLATLPSLLISLPAGGFDTQFELAGCRDRTPIAPDHPRFFRLNVELLPDTDADGLPDEWEQQYFGDLTPGPNDDPDGDGVDNLTEYLQGRNPAKDFVPDTMGAVNLVVFTPLE